MKTPVLTICTPEGIVFSQLLAGPVARFIAWFIDALCMFALMSDLAANTVVIRHPRVSEPDLEQLLAGKFNSLRQHPHLAARLRQRVSPIEASVAVHALLRREDFDPAARVELFADLATHFRAKVE